MKRMKQIALAAALAIGLGAAHANENQDLIDMSDEFAACAAVYSVTAAALGQTGDAAETVRGLERGALAASSYLFFLAHDVSVKQGMAYAESYRDAAKPQVRYQMQQGETSALDRCIELGPLQAELVRDIRTLMAKEGYNQ